MDAWIATNAWRILGRHLRARRSRGPPPDSVLKGGFRITILLWTDFVCVDGEKLASTLNPQTPRLSICYLTEAREFLPAIPCSKLSPRYWATQIIICRGNARRYTSYHLSHVLPCPSEGAPHLREVIPPSTIPTAGGQKGQLVSPVCLESMHIGGSGPSPVLLDHLLIPVEAELGTH